MLFDYSKSFSSVSFSNTLLFIFSFFDKIYCINLSNRTDRWNMCLRQFSKFEMCNVQRFDAVKYNHPKLSTKANRQIGCALSHYNIIKEAKLKNYSNILVLEDDFLFLVSPEQFRKNLNELEKYKNFDVCMLSYSCNNFENIDNTIFMKIIFSQTASGYIVNSHYYDKLISLYEWGIPLLEQTKIHWEYANDIIWKDLQKNDNWIGFKERQGKQMASYSDNSKQICDYNF